MSISQRLHRFKISTRAAALNIALVAATVTAVAGASIWTLNDKIEEIVFEQKQ